MERMISSAEPFLSSRSSMRVSMSIAGIAAYGTGSGGYRQVGPRVCRPGAGSTLPLAAASESEQRLEGRGGPIEVDPTHLLPGHVLGPLAGAGEDEHAAPRAAGVVGVPELQLVAAVEHDLHAGRAIGAGWGWERLDGGDQLERDAVVDALRFGVERVRGLALVEVEDHAPGETTPVARGDAAGEGSARRDVRVTEAAAAGGQLEALEAVPADQDPPVPRVVDGDPAIVPAHRAAPREEDLAPVERSEGRRGGTATRA